MKATFLILFFLAVLSYSTKSHQADQKTHSDHLPSDGNGSKSEETFLIRSWKIERVSLFEAEEIMKVLEAYSGKEVAFEEVRKAAFKIEKFYENAGYLAKVIIPVQDVTEGIVTLDILEARMGEIRIEQGGCCFQAL